jgi:hypothetical protein
MQENLIFDETDIGIALISDMASIPSEREKLVSALNKNGVDLSINATNEELYTAIFTAISESKAFRLDIKKAIYSFLSNQTDNQELSANGGFSPTTATFLGKFVEGAKQSGAWATPTTQTSKEKKKFKDTAVGGFLSGLFTKENASQLANAGINVLTTKLTQRADQQSLDQGIQYQVVKADALDKEREVEDERKKWVVPVIIASSIVVLSIIGYLIYVNSKKKAK